jgi:hypothetical protein
MDKATAEDVVREFAAEFKGIEQVRIRLLMDRADFVAAYGENSGDAMIA